MKSRAQRNTQWIEKYCFDDGQFVCLTEAERLTIMKIYDAPGGPYADVPVTGRLAAYLVLLHVCCFEALQNKFSGPAVEVDSWSIWRATSPRLRDVLRRDGA